MSIYIGASEIKDIYVGEGVDDYSAMQGPAPDGFHVPLTTEWVALYGILKSTFNLGKDTVMMATYLKMPVYGSRSRSNSSVSGSSGYYWSCSPNPNSVEGAYCMYISSSCNSQYPTYRSMGLGVRCFKNLPAKPTSSWTTLYDGSSVASGAGVFYNATDGLISVSGDGQTWYTIMDKNLGATTVYNNGDEKSEANCGGFFQWGNNYGFPFTGSVTTSSTRVNTSNYGPGNYYSSSTFITRANSPYDWSSVQNDNLRGGETGVVKKGNVKEVYVGTTKVRPTTPPYLCFTANTAGSTVRIIRYNNPTNVNFEISTDGISWRDYVLPAETVGMFYRGEIITLTNVGDKVYWRNKSETTTGFSTSGSAYYYFWMSGSINASGNIMFLLNKNGTATSVGNYGFFGLFQDALSLVTSPQLPATTVGQYGYRNMFTGCTNLETLNKLPCISLDTQCYRGMFANCSKIKLSTSKTGEYQTEYRIPISGTGTEGTNWGFQMFNNTGGTFASTPSINTTYYTSNTVV